MRRGRIYIAIANASAVSVVRMQYLSQVGRVQWQCQPGRDSRFIGGGEGEGSDQVRAGRLFFFKNFFGLIFWLSLL